MDSRQSYIPAQLGKLQERFERWRRTHAVRSRLPDELWAAAVRMAGIYGLYRTAKALRLEYNSIKKRVERQAASAIDRVKSSVPKSGDVRFVELATSGCQQANQNCPLTPNRCECNVEWEDAAGSKMRVHLKGTSMPDLVALSRSFWDGGEPAS